MLRTEEINQCLGRVVLITFVGGGMELDRLDGFEPAGGVLQFQRGPRRLAMGLASMKPLAPVDAAQLMVNWNAEAGRPHDPASLSGKAGELSALFPDDLTVSEALRLLAHLTPKQP